MEISERIEQLKIKSKEYRSVDEFIQDNEKEIEKIYVLAFGKTIRKGGKCNSCIIEMYFQLKSLTKTKIQTMKTTIFKLAEGICISMHGMADSYTNANLTNRAALQILKKSRGHIKHFVTLPDNWQDLVANFELQMTEEQLAKLLNSAPSAEAPKEEKVKVDEVKKSLSEMTAKDLYAKAKEMELPVKEWQNKSKTFMVDYIYKAITAE